jgi:hypothetical protein
MKLNYRLQKGTTVHGNELSRAAAKKRGFAKAVQLPPSPLIQPREITLPTLMLGVLIQTVWVIYENKSHFIISIRHN